NLPSGFYRIAIPLERHDSETNQTYTVGTYRDVIHIYDGRLSEKTLDITELIGTPPSAPQDLQISLADYDPQEGSGAWEIDLSWTRTANTAGGYRVYRRVNDDPFTVLDDADNLSQHASSFNNTFILGDQDDTYQYRVVAWNSYGESPPLDSPPLPGDLSVTDGDYTFLVYPDHLVLLAYTGLPSVDIVIPGTLEVNGEERPVTKIAADAFKDKGITERLTIPDTITEIGAGAFHLNSFTGDLEIPDSVVTIGASAFQSAGFSNGGHLILGTTESNLETIEFRAFQDTGFTGPLTIPASVTSIGGSAFQNVTFAGALTLHEGLLTIGSSAFEGASFSNGLTIPDSVTTIRTSAFKEAVFAGPLELGTGLVTLETHIFY
uniref:leucine-rich repeat domain-containing protein n=1 Tax=Alkalispirochaeta alkalica TaxID=46356 RepID=UPI00058CF7A7